MGKKHSRQTKLEKTVATVQRRFGARALSKGGLSAVGTQAVVPHISTGFPSLDDLLCIGGLPKGKISELIGFPTSGKTTCALKFLACAQDSGQQVGYIDQARYFDPDYAHRCGLDLSRLIIGAPYDATEALAMVEALVRNGNLAALVLDTADFLWADARYAQQISDSLGRLSAPMARAGTVFLFLHDPLAGEALALSTLKHYASVRLEVIRENWQRIHSDVRGYEARVKVLKNRYGPAGRMTTISIKFNGTVRGEGL